MTRRRQVTEWGARKGTKAVWTPHPPRCAWLPQNQAHACVHEETGTLLYMLYGRQEEKHAWMVPLSTMCHSSALVCQCSCLKAPGLKRASSPLIAVDAPKDFSSALSTLPPSVTPCRCYCHFIVSDGWDWEMLGLQVTKGGKEATICCSFNKANLPK